MAQDGSKMLLGLVDAGDKGFAQFMDFQLDASIFKGDEADLFLFMQKHATGYGALPKRKTIKKWASENACTIPTKESIDESPKYYLDQIETRNLKLGLKGAMMDAEKLRLANPQASLETLTSDIISLNQTRRRKQLLNFAEDGSDLVHDEYVKSQLNADSGLKFGWPTFDEMSGGLTGGDVVSIIGRPGMGKTYMALHAMLNAWGQGMTTLFVSMEMKVSPIAQRLAAMYTNTSIAELKSAQVSTKKYAKMHSFLKGMSDVGGGMWVADGALSAKVSDVQMLCAQLQPDVLFIDGAYLLRCDNPRLQRHDRINTNVEDIKMVLAEQLNIPVVQSFQFNREMVGKSVEDVDLAHIAGSDAIGQLSSVVLGLFEEDSIETAVQRKIRVLKGRNGEQGEFSINWRFGGLGQWLHDGESKPDTDTSNIMNFSEIIAEEINTEMKFN
jgi:replicative DNA helicase